MARRAAPDADHRAAYLAGRGGRTMPPGVAEKANTNPALDKMHDAGRTGADYDDALGEHAPDVAAAAAQHRAQSPGPRSPRRTRGSGGAGPGPSKSFGQLMQGTPAEAGAGVLLGMVAYALVLSVVNYGASGPALWFKAKFLNETGPSAKTRSSTSSTTSSNGSSGASLA